jgi:hypothetical protein
LRCGAQELVPYEPLFVSVWLENVSVRDATFSVRHVASLTFYLSAHGEDWQYCGQAEYMNITVSGQYVVSSGEMRLLMTATLFHLRHGYPEADSFPFARPGAYRLKAQIVADPGGIVESEPVPIKVVEPTEEDVAAAKILIDNDAESVIQRSSEGRETMQAFQSVMDQYPSSVLADYARYYLGICHLRQAAWDRSCDAETIEKAVDHFTSISDKRPTLRLRALLDQGRLISYCNYVPAGTDARELLRKLQERSAELRQLGLEMPLDSVLLLIRQRVLKSQGEGGNK